MVTFRDVWTSVRADCPDVPPLLLRKWTFDAFAALCRNGTGWSWLRTALRLAVADSRTLASVTATQGSTTVTSAGLFVAGDALRQLRVGSGFPYTLASVTSVNAVELDVAFGEATVTGEATVLDAFAVLPEDFQTFLSVRDPSNYRPLPFWFTQEELDQADPARQTSALARALVAMPPVPASVTSLANRARFEWWPYPTGAAFYPAQYLRQPTTPADTDALPGLLATSSDVLELVVQTQAARWPGPRAAPNNYFNLALAAQLAKDAKEAALALGLRDWERYPQAISTGNSQRRARLGFDSSQLREIDASASEYFSGAFAGF